MRSIVLCLIGLVTVTARADLTAQQPHKDDWGHLDVALTSYGHQSGDTVLVFALYSSGRVLYLAPRDPSAPLRRYNVVTLSPSQRKALVGDLPLNRVGQFHPPMRQGDDGSTECIVVSSGRIHKRDCLWGGIDDDWAKKIPNWPRTPPDMVNIWKRLANFNSPDAQPWVPEQVEVSLMKWGPEWNCGEPTPSSWPTTWPHPTPKTSTLNTGLVGELVLPGSDLGELQRLKSGRTSKGCVQPVMLDGGYYFFEYDIRFPSDTTWRRKR
jgi:hypothetical protein